MKAKRDLTENQKLFGLMLHDHISFTKYFWRDDLTLPLSTRQKLFLGDTSKKILLCSGRKIIKTVNIEARVIRKALAHKRTASTSERMVVTPGENQIIPLQNRIDSKINNNPLFRMLRLGYNKNEGLLSFATNVVWYYRIDGASGTDANMVGLRAEEIIGDEMQLTVRICHASRKQTALPDCEWLYCGVPNGVQHTVFWDLDQTKAGQRWSRHKASTFINPLYWSETARNELQEDYGRGSQEYVTQVMGQWGQELFSSFPPGSIAIDERLPYKIIILNSNEIPVELSQTDILRMAVRLRLPRIEAEEFVVGMDYGQLQDPTEIGVAYRLKRKIEDNIWKMMCRIQLSHATIPSQIRLLQILVFAVGKSKIARFCMDTEHAGLGVAQGLLESEEGLWWNQKLIEFKAGGSIEVDLAGKAKGKLEEEEGFVKRKLIKMPRKQYFTEQLQSALIAARNDLADVPLRLWLGEDEDVENELVSTRERKTEAGHVIYIPAKGPHNTPLDHNTDMLRAIVCAALEAQNDSSDEEDKGDEFEDLGWLKGSMFGRESIQKKPWIRAN